MVINMLVHTINVRKKGGALLVYPKDPKIYDLNSCPLVWPVGFRLFIRASFFRLEFGLVGD